MHRVHSELAGGYQHQQQVQDLKQKNPASDYSKEQKKNNDQIFDQKAGQNLDKYNWLDQKQQNQARPQAPQDVNRNKWQNKQDEQPKEIKVKQPDSRELISQQQPKKVDRDILGGGGGGEFVGVYNFVPQKNDPKKPVSKPVEDKKKVSEEEKKRKLEE
jgi:hypothetical protein